MTVEGLCFAYGSATSHGIHTQGICQKTNGESKTGTSRAGRIRDADSVCPINDRGGNNGRAPAAVASAVLVSDDNDETKDKNRKSITLTARTRKRAPNFPESLTHGLWTAC